MTEFSYEDLLPVGADETPFWANFEGADPNSELV